MRSDYENITQLGMFVCAEAAAQAECGFPYHPYHVRQHNILGLTHHDSNGLCLSPSSLRVHTHHRHINAGARIE